MAYGLIYRRQGRVNSARLFWCLTVFELFCDIINCDIINIDLKRISQRGIHYESH